MTTNEIKIVFEKEQTYAHFHSLTKDGIVYFCGTGQMGNYEHYLFKIPISDVGDKRFLPAEPAKNLIRWLVNEES